MQVPAPGEAAAVAGGKSAGTVGGVVDRIAGGVAKSWTLKDRWWTGRQGQKQHDAPTIAKGRKLSNLPDHHLDTITITQPTPLVSTFLVFHRAR